MFGKTVKKSMCSSGKHTAYSALFTGDVDMMYEQLIVNMQG